MTKVIPTARIALIATCLTRMVRLLPVRKAGEAMANAAVKRTRTMTARNRNRRAAGEIGKRCAGATEVVVLVRAGVMPAPAYLEGWWRPRGPVHPPWLRQHETRRRLRPET